MASQQGSTNPLVVVDGSGGHRPEVVLATTAGAVIGHKEDAAHTSEDGGVMALTVRKDAYGAGGGGSLAGAVGDYAPVMSDDNGFAWVRLAVSRGPLLAAIDTGDAGDGYGQLPAVSYVWDGAQLVRNRSNIRGTLLASAARTATVSASDQTNYSGKGARVYIDVTAIVSTPSVVFTIEVKDPISGIYTAILTSVAITGTGHTVLTVYPGATVAANVTLSNVIGRVWRVTATHGNANSITYSVGYDVIN